MRIIVVVGSIALLAGCSQQQIDKAQSTIESAAPKLANDGMIYAQIEAKFATIDANSALHVAVASHDGDVRLSGRVRSDDTEKKFTQAASEIDGVHHVNATMTVDAKLPDAGKQVNDFALATAVRANVVAQAGLNGVDLGIGAKNGVVTLDGHVKSSALHKTILSTARSTTGVKSVVDRLHDES